MGWGDPWFYVLLAVTSGDNQRCYHDVLHGITREAHTAIEVIVNF